MIPAPPTTPRERLSGAIERVTFHSEQAGFCILRVKVRDQRDLMTVIGSAASVSAGGVEPHICVLGVFQQRTGVSARRTFRDQVTVFQRAEE